MSNDSPVETPCVEYEGKRKSNGYGYFCVTPKTFYAHRVAYCQANGVSLESIAGLVVRHRCDNPPCVNPEHLVLGTHADNNRDKMERGRHAFLAHSFRGSTNAAAKISEADVAIIKSCLSVGERQSVLAAQFGVSQSLISKIKTGRIWRHCE